MNFIISVNSLSKPVFEEKSRSIPLAQPSRPNFDALAPVGIDRGTSLLTIFHVAFEFNRFSFNHASCSLPNIVLLFCGVSAISFLLLLDLASKIKRSRSFPQRNDL